MKTLIEKIKDLRKAGFFDIFGTTVVNSMVSFIYGIFIIRLLTKQEYGTFSYVQNILNFGLMFCSLGGNVGLLQFCAESIERAKKYSYCRFAWKMGMAGSVIIPMAMLLYTQLDNSGISHLVLYTLEFSFLPFLYFTKEWITANLRWQFKNHEYGIVMNLHTILNAGCAICGAYLLGIQGVILGNYIAYIGADVCGLHFLKNTTLKGMECAEKLEQSAEKKFLTYSFTMCVVNALISVLFTIDLFVIGNILKDADQIAMYKTASTIPFALNMVPNSIMVFVYPHIAMHKEDKVWMKKNIRLLYLANGAINAAIGLALMIIAPVLVPVLFGNSYVGIIDVFRILILSYLVNSCFRTPSANLLAALKMSKTALVVSIFTVVVCVTMGIVLVGSYGIIGAAWGSVCTFGIVGIVSFAIIMCTVYGRTTGKTGGHT